MLGRPANAAKVAASLRATSDAPLLFICSPDDKEQIQACKNTLEQVLVCNWDPGPGDFARKINLGFRHTDEPWVFLGADDLVFSARWDVEALTTGRNRKAGVVGTQDMGNALVKRGVQSTHSLVNRTYITVYGGSLDGPGTVYSEAYDHQWVDIELVEVAKHRHRWAFARGSVVEHLHPDWNKAPMDATYEKGRRHTSDDITLHRQRMRGLRNITAGPHHRATL